MCADVACRSLFLGKAALENPHPVSNTSAGWFTWVLNKARGLTHTRPRPRHKEWPPLRVSFLAAKRPKSSLRRRTGIEAPSLLLTGLAGEETSDNGKSTQPQS
jgi:hypothetical protein